MEKNNTIFNIPSEKENQVTPNQNSVDYDNYDTSFMNNYNQIELTDIENFVQRKMSRSFNKSKDKEDISIPEISTTEKNNASIGSEVKDVLAEVPYALNHNEEAFTQSEMNRLLEDINTYILFDENIKKEYSIMADDYLPCGDHKINSEQLKLEYEKFIESFDFVNDIQRLKSQIDRTNLDPRVSLVNIGPVTSLDYLIESSFNYDVKRRKSIIEKIISLDEMIYTWRKIGGDGNCFYRAVIFAYLENIILSQDEDLMRLLILDINTSFQGELSEKLSQNKIKGDLVIKILVLIFSLGKDINLSYELLLKCFISCKSFDLGMIYYFRFKIYEFVKENENKLYTKDFSVKIGNLLPCEYETEEGSFLFNKFYEDYLLKLYKDAEKIVIYLTPFVLKVNLKILVYDFGTSSLEQMKEFPFPHEKINMGITLLYKKTHYDLIYQRNYFDKNIKYLSQYVYLDENLTVITSSLIDEVKMLKSVRNDHSNNSNSGQKSFNANEINVKSVPVQNQEKEIASIPGKSDKSDNSGIPNIPNNIHCDTNINEIYDYQSMNTDKINTSKPDSTSISMSQNIPEEATFTDINSLIPNIRCLICRKEYMPHQTLIKLCRECLLSEVKTNILSKYFKFMEASRGNFFTGKCSESVGLFNLIFLNTPIKIIDDNFNSNVIFKLIDRNFLTFYNFEIKSIICAHCDKSIDTKSSTLALFTLPCNCTLCSESCLRDHLELLFNINYTERRKDFICICSHSYTKNELKRLLYFLHSNNCKTKLEKLVEVFRDRSFNLCMLCLEEKKDGKFAGEKPIICELKDLEVENILKLKQFNHIMCNYCLGETFDKKSFQESKKTLEVNQHQYCMICDGVHFLKSMKLSSKEMTNKSDCRII